jgi:hypothetical protein
MNPDYSKTLSSRTKLIGLIIFLGLFSLAIIITWPQQRAANSVADSPDHPEFGKVYRTEAIEAHYNPPSAARIKLTILLPFIPHPVGPVDTQCLQIGPNKMEWSMRNWIIEKSGYLYCWKHDLGFPITNSAFWEFAPCRSSRLRDVTRADLKCDFYTTGSSRGSFAFGNRWRINNVGDAHLLVKPGTVLLARLSQKPSVVYVLSIVRQEHYRLRVEYVEVDTAKPPNP